MSKKKISLFFMFLSIVFIVLITSHSVKAETVPLNDRLTLHRTQNNNTNFERPLTRPKSKADIIHPLMRWMFNSSVETDRYQSYHWYNATPKKPNISPNGYMVWENNPIARSIDRDTFDVKVDFAKDLMNNLEYLIPDQRMFFATYYSVSIVQLWNVVENNLSSQRTGYPQYVAFDFNFSF